jgi:predicted MFS family arabinose efflux permease
MALAFRFNLISLIIPGMPYMVGLAMASANDISHCYGTAKPERRGRAMATFSVALPLSNGVGALICGSLVESLGYFWMYLVAACIAGGGLMVTIANRAHLK